MLDPDAKVTSLEEQGKRPSVLEERAARRKEQHELQASRQAREWEKMAAEADPDVMQTWLRKGDPFAPHRP